MQPKLALTLLCLISTAVFAAGEAAAQTLYKLIDKNGKVTYSETAPKAFDGKVIRLEIDPNANTATLPKPAAKGEAARSETEGERIIRRRPDTGQEDRVAAARTRLEAAQKALVVARDTASEGDYRVVGNVKGGTRRVPTEEFAVHLAQLDKAVKDAEAALAAVEKGAPL